MSKRFGACFLVCCLVAVSEAALYDIAPIAHDGKTQSIAQTLVSGVSHRTGVNIDFSNLNSWDEEFDSSNETPSFDLASLAGMSAGTEVTVVGIGWDLNLEVQGFSWFSEAVIKMGDDLTLPPLFLVPGEGDDFGSPPASMNYSSGGVISLSDNGLPDLVLTDGVVELELYERFDDVPDAIDATYLAGSTLTFDLLMAGISGDFNADGVYDCLDVDPLVAEIVNGTNSPTFDLTGDGLVDQVDLSSWLAEAGAAELPSGNPFLPADMNLDGFVDGNDFIIWNENRFTPAAAFCFGDVNADGFVDGTDFIVWNEFRFMSSDQVVAVPEPGFGPLGLWLVLLATRRRR